MDIKYLKSLLEDQIPVMVRNCIFKECKNHAITAFKMAMMNFDQELFF
jgi:hypothetical protein